LEISLGKSIVEGPLMYKNPLEEFTTRSYFVIPVYQTVNKGQPHDPKFRSTMWVKKLVTSLFLQKKVAEQEASRLALEIILGKTKDEGPLMYKNSLQEFTTRLDFVIPVYQTINEG